MKKIIVLLALISYQGYSQNEVKGVIHPDSIITNVGIFGDTLVFYNSKGNIIHQMKVDTIYLNIEERVHEIEISQHEIELLEMEIQEMERRMQYTQ
jgi:hypothetical protein